MQPRVVDRFLDKSITMPNGCWLWTASMSGHYGYFRGDKTQGAHKWSYEYFIGAVPDGHVCHHTCGNRWCVNPYHIKAVDKIEHAKMHNAKRTHCPQGHEYTETNTRIYIRSDGYEVRKCRKCDKMWSLASYEKNKHKQLAIALKRHREDPEKYRKRSRDSYWKKREEQLGNTRI